MSAIVLLIEVSLRMIPGFLLFLITFQHHLRYDKKRTIQFIFTISLLTLLLPIICYLLFSSTQWAYNYTIFYMITIVIACVSLIDFSAYRILLVFFTILHWLCCITLIKDWLGQFAQGLVVSWGYFLTSCFLRFWVTLILFPLLLLFCQRQLRPLIDQSNESPFYRYLWCIPLMFILIYGLRINPQDYHYVYYTFNEVSVQKMVIWTISTNGIFYLVIQILKQTITHIHIKKQIENGALQNSIQMKMYENLLQQIKESRRNRHDFRHHIVMMKNYCDHRDFTGLQTYLNKYLDNVSFETMEYDNDHTIINTILQYYHEIAKDKGIAWKVEIHLPKQLTILETDACSLLSNAIENAVEACERMEAKEERWIHVKIQIFHESVYTILIENTYDGSQIQKNGDGIISSKHEGEGMGIFSIQNIVEKYQGVCNFTTDQRIFSLKVMLLSSQGSTDC